MKAEFEKSKSLLASGEEEFNDKIIRWAAEVLERHNMLGLNGLTKIIDCYNEPHRYYHNWQHIINMLTYLHDTGNKQDELVLATLYHDIVYDPRAKDNEEKSAEMFIEHWKGMKGQGELIYDMIMDTKTHVPRDGWGKILCEADLDGFSKSFEEVVRGTDNIFKEFQIHDWTKYKQGRIDVLIHLSKLPLIADKPKLANNISNLIDYSKAFKPKIGVFAGSFNPFHIGHLNILKKAEKIFDKVIIAKGINPDKRNDEISVLPKELQYHQCETYHGMLHDFINDLGYDVTLIRGLRNEDDFKHENMMRGYIKDFNPNINTVYIMCDTEYAKVSSSAIRTLPSDLTKQYLTFK